MMKAPLENNTSRPCVLVLTTTHWTSTARLCMALDGLGCRVELVAPPAHPALTAGVVRNHFPYLPLLPLTALRRAVRLSQPDLLVLADELSFLLTEELAHWSSSRSGEESARVHALLRRSFGTADALPLTRSRIALLRAAEGGGAMIPRSFPLRHAEEVESFARAVDAPWILKADATWGGFGVRSVSHRRALLPTWKHLQQPFSFLQAVRRGWACNEWGHLRLWLRGGQRDVVGQEMLCGPERTGMAVCKDGEVKAAVCFEVEEVVEAHGPSSILRIVDDAAMSEAMRHTARSVGLSGFCGFDFMRDSRDGKPKLLEMNMRPTQLAHIALGEGKDLCAALVRELLMLPEVQDRRAVTDSNRIALFPQEVSRDPSGLRLGEAFHDVPWAAPALMERAVSPGSLPASILSDPRWQGSKAVPEGIGAMQALAETEA